MKNVDTTLFSCSPGGQRLEKQKDDKCKEIYNIPRLGQMDSTNQFSTDASKGFYNGNTVIIDVCLQMAYYMGFSKVYLVGCDCDYSGIHRFDGLTSDVESTPAIRGDFSYIFNCYEVCKKKYEANDREIINCTVGGKLEIFKRRSLEDVMSEKETNSTASEIKI